MPTRRIILLAIAGVLLIYVLVVLPKNQRVEPVAVQRIPVMVASRDIPPYTLLESSDVTSRLVAPEEAEDSFDDAGLVAGMMTTREVRYGNVVRRSAVLEPDPLWQQGETLIFSFYVSTSRIVGGQLRPGHHVDLLVTRPEFQDRAAEARWIAHNLWVVGVYQASGDDVLRPTVTFREEETQETGQPQTGAFGFAQGSATYNTRQGPANLVVVAAHRETGQLIADYLGAQLFEPWVYVRPGPMNPPPEPVARIDGLVFHDLNSDLDQQKAEPGLADVPVILYKEGTLHSSIVTRPDGSFFFDGLEAGVYEVVETDPDGFVSVSDNEVKLRLVAGQNRHVRFSDAAKPEPTATLVPTLVPTSRPAAPTRVPASTRAPATPGPTPVPGECTYRVYMSTTENGSEIPAATVNCKKELWAVIEFSDCGPVEYAILLKSPGSEETAQIGTGAWSGESGRRSIRVAAPEGTFFNGSYTTFLSIGQTSTMRAYNWYADAIDCTGAENPVTGFGFERPDEPKPEEGLLISDGTETGDSDIIAEATPMTGAGFGRGR